MTFDWWTVGFQTVNVLILVWLLHRFFWKPVASIIAARNADAQRILAEAEARRSEAHAALAEIEATRAGFKAEREKILADAHEQAEREKIAAVRSAEAQVAEMRQAATAAIARQADYALKSAADFASALAVTIAGQLAARLSGPAVDAAFGDWLIASLESMDPAARRGLAGEPALELVTARDVEPDARERLGKRISAALGASPRINFRTDPDLVEGCELRSPHFTLRNSWQADLARIGATLENPATEPSTDDA